MQCPQQAASRTRARVQARTTFSASLCNAKVWADEITALRFHIETATPGSQQPDFVKEYRPLQESWGVRRVPIV